MSQPYDRNAKVPLQASLDPRLGEFWVENPWEIIHQGFNLSAFERHRTYLNVQGKDFVDISYLSGSDVDGDGRCVVAGDFRNDGRLDLIVRQVGGGAVLLFENQFPPRHYLKVSLRGHPVPGQTPTSNRQGIGARLTATVQGQRIVRELYPLNSYRSQMPSFVHFGLGDATAADTLEIHWPSGKTQVLHAVAADRHILVDESRDGAEAIEVVQPGLRINP